MTIDSTAKTTEERAIPGAFDHELLIIGAGFSGIGVAIALKKNGFDDFVVIEKAEDVGGTWRQNDYPGLAVDMPTFIYS